MTSFRVDDVDRGWRAIERELRHLAEIEVVVGIDGAQDSELVKVATIQEFGSQEWTITSKQAYFMARFLMQIDPEAEPARFWGTFRSLRGRKMKIPERSFIRAAIDEHRDRIQAMLRRTFDVVAIGQAPTDQVAAQFGMAIETLIKDFAVNLKNPPNAPLTRFVKQSDNPLVDTGRMINSIRYIVRRATAGGAAAGGTP